MTRISCQALLPLVAFLLTLVYAENQCMGEGGRFFKPGQEWRSMDGNFVKKCEVFGNGWQIKVVACASPSNHRIEVGAKRVEDAVIWFCERSSGGGVAMRTEPNPDAECKGGHLPGSRWVDGSFERECQAGAHAKIVGCVSAAGQRVPLGGVVEEKGDNVICERRPDGSISLRNEPNPNAPCGDHPAGARWLEENFEMACEAGGRSAIVGCRLQTGERIPLDGQLRYKGYLVHCQQFANGTHRIFAEPDARAECEGAHPAGSSWIEGSFEKECLPGALIRTIGCVLDNNERIPLGGRSSAHGPLLALCDTFPNGTVALRFQLDPRAPCGPHPQGSQWVERSFEKECRTGGRTEIVGCVTSQGERVPLNGSIVVDGQKIHCDTLQDGTVRFHGEPDPTAPCKGGHSPGERWVDKGFELECQAGARVEVVACVTADGVRVPVDGQQRQAEYIFYCEKQPDGSVRFRSQLVDGVGRFVRHPRHWRPAF